MGAYSGIFHPRLNQTLDYILLISWLNYDDMVEFLSFVNFMISVVDIN